MNVDTFVPPAKDPALAALDKYRAAGHFPAVDYHRVVADNTKGQLDDREQGITFARSQDAIVSGQGDPSAFVCDKLHYEWTPADKATAQTKATYADLVKRFCAIDPQDPAGIPKGTKKTYYLVTGREFGDRGISSMKVFGPRDVPLQ